MLSDRHLCTIRPKKICPDPLRHLVEEPQVQHRLPDGEDVERDGDGQGAGEEYPHEDEERVIFLIKADDVGRFEKSLAPRVVSAKGDEIVERPKQEGRGERKQAQAARSGVNEFSSHSHAVRVPKGREDLTSLLKIATLRPSQPRKASEKAGFPIRSPSLDLFGPFYMGKSS